MIPSVEEAPVSSILSNALPLRCFLKNPVAWFVCVAGHPPCWVKLTLWIIIMAYIFSNDGLPIFDDNESVVETNVTGSPIYHNENMVTITSGNGFSKNKSWTPRATPQPIMSTRVVALINFVTTQVVRYCEPNTTLKCTRSLGCANKNLLLNQFR